MELTLSQPGCTCEACGGEIGHSCKHEHLHSHKLTHTGINVDLSMLGYRWKVRKDGKSVAVLNNVYTSDY